MIGGISTRMDAPHDLTTSAVSRDVDFFGIVRRATHLLWILAGLALQCNSPAWCGVNVVTSRYDNGRTGANLAETELTQSTVSCTIGGCPNFGKRFAYEVEGKIYAQPLVVSGITIRGSTRNVVYVATMSNMVYAFDADDFRSTGSLLWVRRLHSVLSNFVGSASTYDANAVGARLGIAGTPVIDTTQNAMYLVAHGVENGVAKQWLHALDLTTGADKPGSPLAIALPLTLSGQDFSFAANNQFQRVGLAQSQGKVIVSWGGIGDLNAYRGWLMVYDSSTLQQVAYFCTTCGFSSSGQTLLGGGIWQSGRAPVIDTNGKIVFFVGNGRINSFQSGRIYQNHPCDSSEQTGWQDPPTIPPDYYGEALVKLDISNRDSSNRMLPSGAFSQRYWCRLDIDDWDLGGSGPLLIPGTTIVVGGGKQGLLFVYDLSQLTAKTSDTSSTNIDACRLNQLSLTNWSSGPLRQCLRLYSSTEGGEHIMNGPVYWPLTGGGRVFVTNESGPIRSIAFNGTALQIDGTNPIITSTVPSAGILGHPGGIMTLSANGTVTSSGILWVVHANGDALEYQQRGTLRAYKADTLQEIWNSNMVASRDALGYFAKFTPVTVANGKVYVASFPAPECDANRTCDGMFPPAGADRGVGYLIVYGTPPVGTNLSAHPPIVPRVPRSAIYRELLH